jgi:ubiquinol-cytochrome c reductase iron-sulfur subunit
VNSTSLPTTVPEPGLPATAPKPASGEPTRRDFLYIATATVSALGAAATLIPLFEQMNPDASTLAQGGPIEVDLGKVQPGQQIMLRWRDMPIFVLHRAPKTLQALQDQNLLNQLADPGSEEYQQPPYAANWHRSTKPEYGILVGICTHLGCIPKSDPLPDEAAIVADWLGGYFCPCHGSKYDLAGRVFKGVPAPYNLPVPPYRFISDSTVRIGENPPNVKFELSSVRQI